MAKISSSANDDCLRQTGERPADRMLRVVLQQPWTTPTLTVPASVRRTSPRLLMSDPSAAPTSFAPLAASLEPPCVAFSTAVRRIAAAIMPRESGPRSWGRRLGIDKDLAWKAYRIAQSTDAVGVLSVLPGAKGIELLVKAFEDAGCPPALVEQLRRDGRVLQDRLGQEGLDRATLRAIAAGGLDGAAERSIRQRTRAAARRAAALMWGVEAEAGLPTFLVAPSREPGLVDLAFVNLVEGFRRLRPGQPWCICAPIFNFETEPGDLEANRHDERAVRAPESGRHLVADDPLEPIVSRLTDPIARREIRRHPSGRTRTLYYHGDGVPPSHRMRLAWGEVASAVGPMDSSKPDDLAALHVTMHLPVAVTHFGVLFHRGVRRASDPNAALVATLDSTGRRRSFEEPLRLPTDADVLPMTFGEVPRRLSAAKAAYGELLSLAAAALDFPAAEFDAGFRISVKDPPQLSTLSLRWLLAGA